MVNQQESNQAGWEWKEQDLQRLVLEEHNEHYQELEAKFLELQESNSNLNEYFNLVLNGEDYE